MGPTRTEIGRARRFTRAVWPLVSEYLRKLMNEEGVGNDTSLGRPFSKRAWVDMDYGPGRFYLTKTVCGAVSKKCKTYAQITVSVSICPSMTIVEGGE